MGIWCGIGIGTGHPSAAKSGVCRTLARARRSQRSSYDPDWCAARSYISVARGRGFLRSSETSYYASSTMLGAPHRGPLTPPMPHELNLLVISDGGLLRISPRDRVALQDAHLRSGVRLIARN
jgi:hypothetical protein